MSGPAYHGRATHGVRGTDRIVEDWIYVGTDGVDGVDEKLAANPHPYATPDDPGPPSFQNGTNGFALDAIGNPGDGLRYRAGPNGIELDCGGGLTGLAPGDQITTLIGVDHALPDTTKRFLDADDSTDTPGSFVAQLLPSGALIYIGPVGGVIDGGGP